MIKSEVKRIAICGLSICLIGGVSFRKYDRSIKDQMLMQSTAHNLEVTELKRELRSQDIKLNKIISDQDAKLEEKELELESVTNKLNNVKQELENEKRKNAPKVQKVSRGGTRINSKRVIDVVATAYDDTYESQGKWQGQTATGVKPRVGVIAVDPKIIPLGTKLYVESTDDTPDYGYCIAGDTGGDIKKYRVDLFFNTPKEVRAYGRRNVKVHILN